MEYLCGGYDRLSDADNTNDESSSIQSQKMITDSFAKFNNLKIYKHYVDDGYSGGNFDRPAFQEMIDDIECEKINCVITKDLSRLGREMYKTGKYREEYFLERLC
jgi:site-specific DNA recombinase